jgi:hypothetical protein
VLEGALDSVDLDGGNAEHQDTLPVCWTSAESNSPQFYHLLTCSHLLGQELVPRDRSFLLLNLADIAAGVNPALSSQWAQEAFQTANESSNAWDKLAVQKSALAVLSDAGDPDLAMEMFATLGDLQQSKSGQTGEDPRCDAATSVFLDYYGIHGVSGMERIRTTANWLSATGEYPYQAAGALIALLIRDGNRTAADQLFSDAFGAYNRGTHTKIGDDKFADLILTTAGIERPALLKSALDSAISKLSAPDAITSNNQLFHARIYTTGGSFETSDPRKRILVKLLPAAQQLDLELAKRIESVMPVKGTELSSESSMIFGGDTGLAASKTDATNFELSRLASVQRLAPDNQSEAAQLARTFNIAAIKARALAAVASGASSRESSLAFLTEANNVLQSAEADRYKVAAYADLASAYAKAGLLEGSRHLVRDGLELGSKILDQQKHAYSGDPLDELPSFDDMCELAKIGGKVDKRATKETIEMMPDVALRAYLFAELARGLPFPVR